LVDAFWWGLRRRSSVRMVPVPTTAVLFQAWGRKREAG
jgi:2-polyprenyl-6-hydroxyphenyl methylase/3-demethylubiquinone-9 3-methyltransferase